MSKFSNLLSFTICMVTLAQFKCWAAQLLLVERPLADKGKGKQSSPWWRWLASGFPDYLIPKLIFGTIRGEIFLLYIQNHTRILKDVEFQPHDSLVVKLNSLWVVKFRQIFIGIILRTNCKRKAGR